MQQHSTSGVDGFSTYNFVMRMDALLRDWAIGLHLFDKECDWVAHESPQWLND